MWVAVSGASAGGMEVEVPEFRQTHISSSVLMRCGPSSSLLLLPTHTPCVCVLGRPHSPSKLLLLPLPSCSLVGGVLLLLIVAADYEFICIDGAKSADRLFIIVTSEARVSG